MSGEISLFLTPECIYVQSYIIVNRRLCFELAFPLKYADLLKSILNVCILGLIVWLIDFNGK